MGGLHCQFLDVGGARNERKKWIHWYIQPLFVVRCFIIWNVADLLMDSFDNVDAIIFTAAISEFDQVH
jgi:hypothetical protein